MPVLVMNGTIVVTPAARKALSAEAIEFAVLHGMANNDQTDRGRVLRQWGIVILGALSGFLVSSTVHGLARPILAILVTILSIAALLFASATIQSKWPSKAVDRRILSALSSFEGAREYAQVTGRFDLNHEVPEEWGGPHGRLVDLDRLEQIAREMKVTFD